MQRLCCKKLPIITSALDKSYRVQDLQSISPEGMVRRPVGHCLSERLLPLVLRVVPPLDRSIQTVEELVEEIQKPVGPFRVFRQLCTCRKGDESKETCAKSNRTRVRKRTCVNIRKMVKPAKPGRPVVSYGVKFATLALL